MPKVGQFYRITEMSTEGTLAVITRVFNKQVIDPNCLMAVEIITHVEFQWLEGTNLGLTRTKPIHTFRAISQLQNQGA